MSEQEHAMTPVECARYCHLLYCQGTIEYASFALSLHVLTRMSLQGTQQVTLSREDTDKSLIEIFNDIRIGSVPDGLQFIEALQELHFIVGIKNHYRVDELDNPNWYDAHFSLNPFTSVGREWNTSSPISYRLDAAVSYRFMKDHIKGEYDKILVGRKPMRFGEKTE